MAEYKWTPMTIDTTYGPVNINDPLAVEEFRARIQAEQAKKQADYVKKNLAIQKEVAEKQNTANLEIENQKLAQAQVQYDAIIAQQKTQDEAIKLEIANQKLVQTQVPNDKIVIQQNMKQGASNNALELIFLLCAIAFAATMTLYWRYKFYKEGIMSEYPKTFIMNIIVTVLVVPGGVAVFIEEMGKSGYDEYAWLFVVFYCLCAFIPGLTARALMKTSSYKLRRNMLWIIKFLFVVFCFTDVIRAFPGFIYINIGILFIPFIISFLGLRELIILLCITCLMRIVSGWYSFIDIIQLCVFVYFNVLALSKLIRSDKQALNQ